MHLKKTNIILLKTQQGLKNLLPRSLHYYNIQTYVGIVTIN